jgi:hypothetical protein
MSRALAKPMPGSPIGDVDHVLRYVRPKHVDAGVVNGAGFLRRPEEDASSVNWMEHFPGPPLNQVAEIKARKRISYAKTGVLARVNVGETKAYVQANDPLRTLLTFEHDPLDPDDAKNAPADWSHALIRGIPIVDTPEAELVKDLMADCVLETYPTN